MFYLIFPWILVFIIISLLFIPTNKIKRSIILVILGLQLFFCLIIIIFSSVYIQTNNLNELELGLSISAIVMAILLIFISIYRRWQIAKETILGN